MKLLGQALAYAVFAVLIGFFSVWPEYRLLQPAEAMISVTFSHAGKRVGDCRQLTQEEQNALPPNMRRPADCPRERHPVFLRLSANEEVLLDEWLEPSGFWSDGKSNVYRRFRIDAGQYLLDVGMNDSGSRTTLDRESRFTVSIEPGQNLVIGFDEKSREFILR